MGGVPKAGKLVEWALRRLLPPNEVRVVLDELRELHEHLMREHGPRVADRRYRRELRRYPFRLLGRKLRSVGPAFLELTSLRSTAQAVRSLVRVPALSSAVILTIGVGIGGCTAIYAVVDVLLIRPLPYPDADEIVWIHTHAPPNRWPFSVADYQGLVEQQTTFESVAAYTRSNVTVTTADIADRVLMASVSPGFFELLGVALVAGRGPLPEDGDVGAEPTIVVTPGFAGRYLSSSGAVGDLLDRTIRLDGTDHRVIGVLPDRHGPLGSAAQAFPTLRLEPPPRRGPFFLSVFGRLRAEPEAAASELRAINDRIFPVWADSYQDDGATWGMASLESLLLGDTDRIVLALMASVGLLLLMGTANAANLLLARVGSRRQELAVRVALGASRGRVVGYLLVESLILALGGMAVGLAVAWGGIELMPTVASAYIPRLDEVELGGSVLLFTAAVALASGMLFGLISAFGPGTGELTGELRAAGRSATQSARQHRTQRLLVVGQLAVAVPLLAGAALLASTFSRLASVDPGFRTEGLVSVRVPLAGGTYPDEAARQAFWDVASARLEAIPGVRAIGVGSGRPPSQVSMINNFNLEDRPTPPGTAEPAVPWANVDNGYFEALGIPLLAGRLFEPADIDNGSPVVLVDQAWADRFFPGEEVIGRRMVSGGCTSCPLNEVVGVVGTVPYLGLRRADEGAIYGHSARTGLSGPVLHIRTEGDPLDVIPLVRAELRAIDPTVPLTDFITGDGILSEALTQPRHLSMLLGVFSVVAMLLATVGLYGIMAYSVQRRRGDIAIRLALGGAPADVLRMVLRQGMALVVGGLLLGVVGSLAFTRVLSDLLYEIEADDPLTLAAVAGILLAVSFLACSLPGRRAVRVDPADALRSEA